MAFWPASSTWISATPVGAATRRTQLRSTAAASESRQCLAGKGIVAHGAGHRNLGTRPPRCERLIRALAARKRFERLARDRLAGQRQPRDPCHQIEIDRAEDDDHLDTARGSVLRPGS